MDHMDEEFWKERIAKKYKLLEYDGGKIKNINWGKVHDGTHNPLLCIDDEALRHFWDILLEENIVSLFENGNYVLVAGTGMFMGPRSRNSGTPLFFTKREDAEGYEKAFFSGLGNNSVNIFRLSVG